VAKNTLHPTKPLPTSPGFLLDTLDAAGRRTSAHYPTLLGLAQAVCRVRYSETGVSRWAVLHGQGQAEHWLRAHLRCYSPHGRALDPVLLAQQGAARLTRTHRPRNTQPLDRSEIRAQGPVAGIHAYRGGPRMKHPRTMAQRRQSLAWLAEEVQVQAQAKPRTSQQHNYLPNSQDLRWRDIQRSWKEQTKGRKAWDRPTRTQ